MKVSIPTVDGFLADRYGKYAPADCKIQGHPVVSFPITIEDVPEEAKSLALVFIDFDSVPVGGFVWIHWLACNISPDVGSLPENASRSGVVSMVQGANSTWSPMAGGTKGSPAANYYTGPYPPDKDHEYTLKVYALDSKLDLNDGYYLNEFLRAIKGHVLAKAKTSVWSRS